MPAIGQIYQVTYQGSTSAGLYENVIHFREITGASTPAQIATSAEKFLAAIAPVSPSNMTFPSMIIKQMTPLAFDESIVAPVSTVVGTGPSGFINTQVAAIFTKRTGTAGKTHRGRIYLMPCLNHSTSGNTFNPAGGVAAATAAAALISTFGPTGTDTHLQIGVYSRAIGGSSPFTVAGWQPLTSIDPQNTFGAQRRRRQGVGV